MVDVVDSLYLGDPSNIDDVVDGYANSVDAVKYDPYYMTNDPIDIDAHIFSNMKIDKLSNIGYVQ